MSENRQDRSMSRKQPAPVNPAGEAGQARQKLPHERDEAAGPESTGQTQTEGNTDLMRQAHDDIASGKQDTDRGPPADQAYRRQKR